MNNVDCAVYGKCPKCRRITIRIYREEGKLRLHTLPHKCLNHVEYDLEDLIKTLDDPNVELDLETIDCVPNIH